MSGKSPTSAASSNPISTKWAVGLIAALIVYALLQPVLNRQFGWQLPSLTTLQQGDIAPSNSSKPDLPSANSPTPKSTGKSESPKSTSPSKTNASQQKPLANSTEALRYGVLRETAPDDFLSPGGLRYTRGSAEGHRLKHIERHLTDDPGRPGKHGVFEGDMGQVIRWIDEAYDLAQRGAKGTKKQEEDGRMIYEANFAQPIGFIGGRDGRRDNNPDARRLRLVVEGNKVITAFPF